MLIIFQRKRVLRVCEEVIYHVETAWLPLSDVPTSASQRFSTNRRAKNIHCRRHPGRYPRQLYADAEWCGHSFTLIDTGGLEIKSEDVMWSHIRAQAQIAVETADVIVFMLDGKTGLTHEDYEVAAYLRKSRKPILLVVNKLDNNEQHLLYDFYELGLGEPIGISAGQAKGLGDVLDEIVKLTGKYETEEKEEALKIAVVGKPNAGKAALSTNFWDMTESSFRTLQARRATQSTPP